MFGGKRVLFAIAAASLAMPTFAQTPASTTAFDGTYAGVSRTLEGTMRGGATRSCPPNGRPAPLTIVNGIARTPWDGTAEGPVTPQGVVVMRAPHGQQFDGQ